MAALVGIDKLSHEDAAKNWLAGWLRRRIEAFHSNSKAVKDLNLSPGFNGRGGTFFFSLMYPSKVIRLPLTCVKRLIGN